MSPITRPEIGLDFASALPLSNSASASLERAFEMGWLDPSKLHHDSANFRNLIEESRESIATNLGVGKSDLEFVGELGFGYWAALSGALTNSSQPFIHGATDRQVVHAFARDYQGRGREVMKLSCGQDGLFDYVSATKFENPWIFWQATNRETGVEQAQPKLKNGNFIADMTASFDPKRLPDYWDVALWDPRSFAGPEGIAILAINEESEWRSPIPPIDKRRLFGSFSKPLLVLTAIALEEWSNELSKNQAYLAELNRELRNLIATQISGAQLVGESSSCDPRNLAVVFSGVIGEELLRRLDQRGIKVDAGSACGAGALSPSHVLEAMGYGLDGQIRITLKPGHSKSGVAQLVAALAQEVLQLRD
ncbi:MAG: hypothetical protein EBX86_00525 [Actinobacteria bacterium]|nr:hypothetical protein [Actinomycetota bacterium]